MNLPYSARIPRKAKPTGCNSAWWYLETNGDITIYGNGPSFSCTIKARSLKVLRKARPSSTR